MYILLDLHAIHIRVDRQTQAQQSVHQKKSIMENSVSSINFSLWKIIFHSENYFFEKKFMEEFFPFGKIIFSKGRIFFLMKEYFLKWKKIVHYGKN
jgi:hypothetical protein